MKTPSISSSAMANPELKAWAASTRPALEHHLEMAKELNK